jgi:isoleucyl-tRNA synthetase
MDDYDNYGACERLTEFVDALSNWYVRRSRDRFWSGEATADKSDAHWALYECLLTTCKLIAPFVPFLAEEMWQNLAVAPFKSPLPSGDDHFVVPEGEGRATHGDLSAGHEALTPNPSPKGRGDVAESVHLCDYPIGDPAVIDEDLSTHMALVREVVSLGLSARMGAKLKVRQPLARVEIVLADRRHQAWLETHAGLICAELNVKRVDFIERADQYITYTILPDLKRLGPQLGKRLPGLRKALAAADGGTLLAELETKGSVTLDLPDGPVVLDSQDIQVRLQAKEGWAAAQGHSCVVVLSTELDAGLIREGLARELVRAIQDRRKEMDCQFTDRIEIGLVTDSQEFRAAVEQFREYIQGETLAVEISSTPISGAEPLQVKVAEYSVTLYIKVKENSK